MIVLIYVLKLVVCTALFYGYYFFFLRNTRMHQYNRFYILASIIFSVVLPLIKLPLLSAGNDEQAIAKTLHGIAFGGWEKEIIITAKQGFLNSLITSRNILISVYVTGFLFTLFPVIKSLAYIRTLLLKHHPQALNIVQIYNTAEPGTPFSFFNTVFWNENISIETEEGQHILRHELYHVQQKHSYDILFMQLASSLFWFNPFCYLLNKELKVIHEFLADEYAASATDRHYYAELLVMQAVSPKQIFISNQFFYDQIKRRITMILQHNNTRYGNVRKLMAVPVLLLIFCACSVKNKDEFNPSPVSISKVNEKKDSMVVAFLKEAIQKRLHAANGSNEIFTKAEIEPGYPGGASPWMRYLNKAFRYPQEAQEKEIQGTVVVQFIVDKDGNVSNVEAIKGPIEGGLREEAVRVITNSGKWEPAYQNGHKVTCYKKQPITFKLEAE